MSSLTEIDKRYLENLLGMQSGYVLDYSDPTFHEFFNRHGIDIHSQKYQTYGSSKAKKLRAFWEQDSDVLVGRTLGEMLDVYEVNCVLNSRQPDVSILEKSREIVARLTGSPVPPQKADTVDAFLHSEFSIPNIQKLPIEATAVPIIENRLNEARVAMSAGAYLSTIFLCGSVLEAVLLGAAQKEPARFNRASASPKTADGSVKRFYEWSLAQFIDVACEVGLLKPDVKKFSHGLRDFRNYIHPYEQMASGFTPDEHTAKVCFQVLKAALASVAGERK
ncbi:hypothetical protein [Gluconobacter japonicus]|uniref:hypothetical protein n=1 Tax=Gluconobacter japonicus TaxID=376620 RepID=UPI00078308BC|nr:hypothetical protein [Gluconobacter japonicus]KXV27481.1 hypothetical protein AD937_04820 [Gluconobacter japonicus]